VHTRVKTNTAADVGRDQPRNDNHEGQMKDSVFKGSEKTWRQPYDLCNGTGI